MVIVRSMNAFLFDWLTGWLIDWLIHVVEGISANSPVTENHWAVTQLCKFYFLPLSLSIASNAYSSSASLIIDAHIIYINESEGKLTLSSKKHNFLLTPPQSCLLHNSTFSLLLDFNPPPQYFYCFPSSSLFLLYMTPPLTKLPNPLSFFLTVVAFRKIILEHEITASISWRHHWFPAKWRLK